MKKTTEQMTSGELTAEIKRTLRLARQGVQAASKSVAAMEEIMAGARRQDFAAGREPYIVPLQ